MERKKTLTSSNFGSVMNLRKHIQPKFVLERILTREKFKIAACDWGIQNEKNASGEYAIKLNLSKTKWKMLG